MERRHPQTPGVFLMDEMMDELLVQVVASPTHLQAA
jgi:hypothetical protein